MTEQLEYTARPACVVCGQYLDLLPPPSRRGRRRQYCSNRCRQIAYRVRQAYRRSRLLATDPAAARWLDALEGVDINKVYREHKIRSRRSKCP